MLLQITEIYSCLPLSNFPLGEYTIYVSTFPLMEIWVVFRFLLLGAMLLRTSLNMSLGAPLREILGNLGFYSSTAEFYTVPSRSCHLMS